MRSAKPSRIFTSPLGRARETATIIAGELGATVVEVPALAEMNFGIFEGKSRAALHELFDDFFRLRSLYAHHKLFVPYPEGESYFDVYLRVLHPFFALLAREQPEVIVGHESINRILRGLITGKPFEQMIQDRQKNNEVVRIDIASGKETITQV